MRHQSARRIQRSRPPAATGALLRCWLLGLALVIAGEVGAASDIAAAASSVPAIEVSARAERIDLTPKILLLEDKTARLDFAQVRVREDFQPAGAHAPNFGFTTSAWWVKFRIHNPLPSPQQIAIRQDYPLIDYFDLWYSQPQADSLDPVPSSPWQHIATGDRRRFDSRPLDNRTFIVPITLPPLASTEVYVRFETQGSLNIGLYAHSSRDLVRWVGREYLAIGIYYGGFLVLIVYNLIMFLSVRERAFVYYLLYALNYGLYFAVHNGITFQFLWPENVWIANQSLLILLSLSLYWALRFTRTILVTDKFTPRLDRVGLWLEWLVMASLAIAPFFSYHTMIVPMAFFTLVICGLLMVMAIITAMRGSLPARYYLTAFTALLLGVFIYILKTFGFLPHNLWTQNAFQVGSLIEMVLLSIAVASRVNELKQQTYVDTLTRLHNRRYMNDHLAEEMRRARKKSQPLAIAIVDIDHFKRFNDTHGHAVGDKALQTVARVLTETVRKPSTACRYGGEEFVLILPNTGETGARSLAERIRERVETVTAEHLALTVSIGYASTESGDYHHEHELFEAADFALYQAKGNGRNQVMHFVREADRRHGPTAPVS